MSEIPKLSVAVDNLPENERLIFKLIFSVSERSKNRTHHFMLNADHASDQADIIVSGDCAAYNNETGASCIQVVNELPASATVDYIQRPLIATRVLSTLDKLVKDKDLLNKPASEEPQEDSINETIPAAEQVAETDHAADASSDEMIDFSISEEEASELAIVHDDTLANPANAEEEVTAEAGQQPEETVAATSTSNIETLQVADKGKIESAEAEVVEKSESNVATALVVDDSASVRKQLEIELDLFEVQVDFAEDAERAFDLLDSKSYDVAFLDVVLPDKDGFQICKKIKTDNDMKNTKVVMLTGKASHADKVRGSLAGCDAYLVKPVGRSTFQTTVKKYLTPIENVEVMEA